jgi:hypothetical protein
MKNNQLLIGNNQAAINEFFTIDGDRTKGMVSSFLFEMQGVFTIHRAEAGSEYTSDAVYYFNRLFELVNKLEPTKSARKKS